MSKYLNLNTLQTVLSGVNALLIVLLTQVGCLPEIGTDKMVCTVSNVPFLTVSMLGWAATISNALKFIVIPWLQPGGLIRNLFEPKVPVTTAPAPGTVSPLDVR